MLALELKRRRVSKGKVGGRVSVPCWRLRGLLCGAALAVSVVSEASADLIQVPPEQVGLSAEGVSKITRYFEREVEAGRIAGAVGLIARHGRVGYLEAVGYQDVEAKTPMKSDSLFRIASMTKAITSAGVMMLVEEGKLQLSDPISQYLPEFGDPNVLSSDGTETRAAEDPPTIGELLTHTSGIGYGWFSNEAQNAAYREADIPDILIPVQETIGERVARLGKLPLAFEPGSQWDYGLSVDVLGRVLETVSGLTVAQYFEERILRPLSMHDTHFYLPGSKQDRLASLYTPEGDAKKLRKVGSDIVTAGTIKFSADFCEEGKGKIFAGGSGLVSSTMDYARFLQMLLDGGQALMKPSTVALMTQNQIGDLRVAFPGHGDGFGYGFGVLTERGVPEDRARVGTYSWGGIFNTYYWVDPQEEMIGLLMLQVFPKDHLSTREDFKRMAYEAIDDSGLYRRYWYEKGVEHGNPFFNNRQLRVNAPEVSTHETFAERSEPRSSGMARVLIDEDLRTIRRADLLLELWGGHPGTAGHRVTVNGRSRYSLPEVGTASKHCTHSYPSVNLTPNDLVRGHNALQFACDQGTTFWGHYIVDNAMLRIGLDTEQHALGSFRGKVSAAPEEEREVIALRFESSDPEKIARVDYQARYWGYDENGNGWATDWHGMTKGREPYGMVGSSEEAPYAVDWDVTMLPAQSRVAVRAMVTLKVEDDDLVYWSPIVEGLEIPERASAKVSFHHVDDLPTPFWSRDDRVVEATITLPGATELVESAELHVVSWAGGAGEVKDYFTLNGYLLPVSEGHDHDVQYVRIAVDPSRLRDGANVIRLHSDTKHHGIEILKPGPALVLRSRQP